MTPSNWHSTQRDAGHDDMQAAVYNFLCDEGWDLADKGWQKAEVFVEYPFTGRGKLAGFADLAVMYHRATKYEHEYTWVFFEIKPVIESVGAVIRQCRAINHLAKWVTENGITKQRDYTLIAVVYDDDPKLSLLKTMFSSVWPISRDTVSTFMRRVVS